MIRMEVDVADLMGLTMGYFDNELVICAVCRYLIRCDVGF